MHYFKQISPWVWNVLVLVWGIGFFLAVTGGAIAYGYNLATGRSVLPNNVTNGIFLFALIVLSAVGQHVQSWFAMKRLEMQLQSNRQHTTSESIRAAETVVTKLTNGGGDIIAEKMRAAVVPEIVAAVEANVIARDERRDARPEGV